MYKIHDLVWLDNMSYILSGIDLAKLARTFRLLQDEASKWRIVGRFDTLTVAISQRCKANSQTALEMRLRHEIYRAICHFRRESSQLRR